MDELNKAVKNEDVKLKLKEPTKVQKREYMIARAGGEETSHGLQWSFDAIAKYEERGHEIAAKKDAKKILTQLRKEYKKEAKEEKKKSNNDKKTKSNGG